MSDFRKPADWRDLPWRSKMCLLHQYFIEGKWKLWSNEDKRFLALALCGEAGELANLIKKQWRGDKIELAAIASEMADIRIYLELLATAYDIPIPVSSKLDEVADRRRAQPQGDK